MPRRQKLVFAGLILAGFAMFVFAGLVSDGEGSDMSVSQNPAIDRIIPNRGDEVLQQQTVGIDLASGYRLVRLTISPDEACRFPVDVTSQVRHVEGLQQYLFTPNPGQLVEQLAADSNCAIATFEEIANPGTTQQIDWTFTVS